MKICQISKSLNNVKKCKNPFYGIRLLLVIQTFKQSLGWISTWLWWKKNWNGCFVETACIFKVQNRYIHHQNHDNNCMFNFCAKTLKTLINEWTLITLCHSWAMQFTTHYPVSLLSNAIHHSLPCVTLEQCNSPLFTLCHSWAMQITTLYPVSLLSNAIHHYLPCVTLE